MYESLLTRVMDGLNGSKRMYNPKKMNFKINKQCKKIE